MVIKMVADMGKKQCTGGQYGFVIVCCGVGAIPS